MEFHGLADNLETPLGTKGEGRRVQLGKDIGRIRDKAGHKGSVRVECGNVGCAALGNNVNVGLPRVIRGIVCQRRTCGDEAPGSTNGDTGAIEIAQGILFQVPQFNVRVPDLDGAGLNPCVGRGTLDVQVTPECQVGRGSNGTKRDRGSRDGQIPRHGRGTRDGQILVDGE